MADKISTNKKIQAEYEEMLDNGVAPKLAEMLALQAPPNLQTDTRFLHGESESARYSSQLARYPGDPEAYVSSRADVLRVAKKRGMMIEGTYGLKYKPENYDAPYEEPETYRVADDIVENAVLDIAEEHPEALHDPDLRDTLRKRFSGDAAE